MLFCRTTPPLIEYREILQNHKNHFWDVEAAGSNPVTPTMHETALQAERGLQGGFLFCPVIFPKVRY